MDIRKFAVSETGIVNLRDASGSLMYGDDKKPMTWTVYGPGSKQYAKAQSARQNRYIDKLRRKGSSEETAEQKLREQIEFITVCTKECSTNIQYDGLTGEELHRAVLSDIKLGFILDQLGGHLGEWGNFSQPSTMDSASTSDKAPG